MQFKKTMKFKKEILLNYDEYFWGLPRTCLSAVRLHGLTLIFLARIKN